MIRILGFKINREPPSNPLPDNNQPTLRNKWFEWKMQVIAMLSKADSKASRSKRIAVLLIYCGTMLFFYLFNFWFLSTDNHSGPVQPQTIVLPKNIAIPDSLGVKKRKFNQQWLQPLIDSNIKY